MFTVFHELNWLAVALAAVAYYLLGALWFGPLFGKAYDTALGFEREKHHKWPPIYYVGPLASTLLVVIATAVLLRALDVSTLAHATTLAVVVGIGYSGSVSINNSINPKTPRPLLYGAVTGSYHLAGTIAAAAIIYGLR